ncbi:hypothetical protein [Amycolatopsis samaneae]|uniref:Uncharacterized protein n=1 Tax=Amycolatopsis samaneae TaxID=664691 RepID=A0ABW5GWF2_9PSEU
MRELRSSPDLVLDGEDSPEQAEIRRRAALAVSSRAHDAEDCALLLDMLGLHEAKTPRSGAA